MPIYGQMKLHQSDAPMRPVVAFYSAPTYKLAEIYLNGSQLQLLLILDTHFRILYDPIVATIKFELH